jgi:hypothetical protein
MDLKPALSILLRYRVSLMTIAAVLLTTIAARAVPDDPVRFDVPALVAVDVLPALPDAAANEQLVEIILPVSCWVDGEHREQFEEFRFDVHWNRSVYPLVDYSPRTLMQSPVEGVVAIERRTERNLTAGVDTKSPMIQLQPAGHIEGGLKNSETTSFGEIPQHEMLVASGTIQRGTGAFFRYHPSRQYALEGGREVCLRYSLPLSWRGGILRVVCTATGHKKLFAGLTEPVRAEAAFVVPVYLRGDAEARDVAVEYVREEQRLRSLWEGHQQQLSLSRSRTWLASFPPVAARQSGNRLPASWVSDLVQAPLDDQLERDRANLPAEIRMAAEDFVAARQRLVALSLPDNSGRSGQSAWQTRSPTSVVE